MVRNLAEASLVVFGFAAAILAISEQPATKP